MQAALEAVNSIGAVVDAIIVGDNPDGDLRRIVSAAEGECYQVSSLGEGFELLESEAVVSLQARRGGAEKPAFKQRDPVDFRSIAQKTLTQGNAVPAVQDVVRERHASSKVVTLDSANSLGQGSLSAPTCKRVMAELNQAAKESPAGIHVFPTAPWEALVTSPYLVQRTFS